MTSMALLIPYFFNAYKEKQNQTQIFQSENRSAVEALPPEIMQQVFNYLPAKDLAHTEEVCRIWRNITKELASNNPIWEDLIKRDFPDVSLIDEAVWKENVDLEKHKLHVDDLKPLSKKDYAAIYQGQKLETDLTLLVIPKGLNRDVLDDLAKEPKKGKETKTMLNLATVKSKDTPVQKTHRVLLTNLNLISEDEALSRKEQKDRLQKHGFEMAKLLPQLTLNVMGNMTDKIALPSPFISRCDETSGKNDESYLAVSFKQGNDVIQSIGVDPVDGKNAYGTRAAKTI